MRVCFCDCHIAPDEMRAFTHAGVNVSNVVEAAAACLSCQNFHTPALRATALPNDGAAPSRRGVVVTTPEGRTLSWEQYEREMQQRTDTWRDSGGENGR